MITYDSKKCVGCNACIRVCPVLGANKLEIKEDESIGINIDENECIKCGACIIECCHGARNFTDDTERFLKDVQKKKNLAIIVAPAIKIAFDGNWRHVLYWLKAQGVKYIFDVSLGADLCTWSHIEYLKEYPNKKLISQPCAAIVNYVEKHANHLIENLSPIHSPMSCIAIYIRKKLGKSVSIAALSPCIAKEDEFYETGFIEYNVTFEKLKKYFNDNRINLSRVEIGNSNFSSFEFDVIQGMVGSIYPRPGGLKDNLKLHNPSLNVINAEGVGHIYRILDEYSSEKSAELPQVFDVLSCERGCIGGPAIGQKYSVFKMETIMHNVENYVLKRNEEQIIEEENQLFANFEKEFTYKDFMRTYKKKSKRSIYPSNQEIVSIFNRLGKTTKDQFNYDCHACGYKSCKDMAVAIYKGINMPESCMQYNIYLSDKRNERIEMMVNQFAKVANELNSVTEELNKGINLVKNDADKIDDIGNECLNGMGEITSEFNLLDELSVNIHDAIDKINESVLSYARMTSDVERIAKQINILSLNAKVEATRAGEFGKGFSVVAGEIRNLSGSSQKAVKNAESSNKMINKSTENVADIVEEINKTIKILNSEIERMKGTMDNNIEHSKSINSYMLEVGKLSESISDLVNQTIEICNQ